MKYFTWIWKLFVCCVTGLLMIGPGGLSCLQAATPELNSIFPRGGMRGSEVEINLRGARLFEPQELLFYRPGITVKSLSKVSDKHVKAVLSVAADAGLGEYPIRLRCKEGVTYMRTFWIGQFATVRELEPNNDFMKAQVVELNKTVQGVAGLEDIDYYRFSAKKGQRISAEIEAMRLGGIFFDSSIAILDARRFELANSDDSPLLKQDGYVSVIAPEDGEYTVLVRESAYEGSNRCHYRLHLGHFSRPSVVYPPAAKPGEPTQFTLIGDPAGPYSVTVVPVGEEGEVYPLMAENEGLTAPSANPVLLSSLPFVNEREPNGGSKQANGDPGLAAPCAFHGVIAQKADVDWFRFKAKKNQKLRIRARSRELRSPLDSVLILRDASGKQLARNDDQGGVDSIIDFSAPADGNYYLNIRDHLGKGGADYTYRIEIDARHARLSASLPVLKRNDSQLRKVICVPRGNRYATVVNISRKNIRCDCLFEASSLPQGVSMQTSTAPKSSTSFLALFEAKGDAPIAGGLHHFSLRDAKAGSVVRGHLREAINHIEINNVGVFHDTVSDRVAVAVIEKAPFHIELQAPAVPIVRNGTVDLKLILKRQPDFDAAVSVTLPWKSPGLGAPTQVTIPKGQSEAVYRINASKDALLGEFLICVSAEAKSSRGTVMVSSEMVALTVTEPMITASLEMASTIPGENTVLVCKISHHKPIEGSAEISLLGLPHGVKAKPAKIDGQSKEVVFHLEVAADAPKGNHNALFCSITPRLNGQIVYHNSAHGGVLRINPPPPAKKTAAKVVKKPSAPAKKKPTQKPLSRLEQLRQRNKTGTP